MYCCALAASLASSYFQKDTLHWSPAQASLYPVIMMMAWQIKPILGWITDNYALCGYHRISYILVSMIISSAAWLASAGATSTLTWVFFQTIINTAICMAFVCGEAVVVEISKGKNVEDGNKLQTWIWGSGMVGGLIGGLIGGQLEANIGYKTVFLLSALPPRCRPLS